MPNPYHLKLFNQVVESSGLSPAARKLGFTPAALSASMLQLEADIGGQLFVRQPFKLTALGFRWYEPVALYSTLIDGLSLRAKNDRSFTFVLGASEYVMEKYMTLVTEMIERYGGSVNYDLDTCHQHEVVSALREGKVDVAISALTADLPPDLEMLKLMSLAPVLLVPATPAYAKIRSAGYFWRQGTVRERLITPYPNTAVSIAFQHCLRLRQVKWPQLTRCRQVGLVAKLVAAGRGVGLSVNLPSLVRHPGVRVLPLPGLPLIEYGLLWNRATREHCGALLKALQATAHDRFRVSPRGTLISERRESEPATPAANGRH